MKVSIDEKNIIRALQVGHQTQPVFSEPEGWQQSVMQAVSVQSPLDSMREEHRDNYMTMFLSTFSILLSVVLIRYGGASDFGVSDFAFDLTGASSLASYIGIDPGQLVNF